MKNIIKIIFLVSVVFVGPQTFAASLSVSPSSQTKSVGDTFSVNITLNTEGVSIDGVDVLYLNYNPSILELVDANSSVSGVQITPGTLMSDTIINNVDTSLGKITFSQLMSSGNTYSGSGTLATITFNSKSAGTANLTFDYTPGSTLDSNIASNGSDVLTSVVNGTYTISAPISSSSGSSSFGGGSGGGGGSSSRSSSGSSSSNLNPSFCAPGQQISSLNLNRKLILGSKGDDVKALQTFLVQNGYTTDDNITGFFGSITQATVQKFQKALNIVSSGSPETTGYGAVGPFTRTKINALVGNRCITTNSSTQNIQSLQEQIKILQAQVNALLLKLKTIR